MGRCGYSFMIDTTVVQALALLRMRLVDDQEVLSITGLSENELDAAMADESVMQQVRAEAVRISMNGGRAEMRALRALDAAASRLQSIAEDSNTRPGDIVAATNALATLAGTREKMRARHLELKDDIAPTVSFAFYMAPGDKPLSPDEYGLVLSIVSRR